MTEKVDLSTIENIKAEIDVLRRLVDDFQESQYKENPTTIGFRFGTIGSAFASLIAGKQNR